MTNNKNSLVVRGNGTLSKVGGFVNLREKMRQNTALLTEEWLDKLIKWAKKNEIINGFKDKNKLKKTKGLGQFGSLTSIPDEFANLKQLEDLSFYSCDFKKFPKAICELYNLKRLDLEDCKLGDLPNEFLNLTKLEILDVSGSYLSDKNLEKICKLSNLKELDLNACNLKSLPNEIANLQKLEKLVLDCSTKWKMGDGYYENFPKVIFKLKILKELYFGAYDVSRYENRDKDDYETQFIKEQARAIDFDGFAKLPNLESLYFSNCNTLVWFPKSICTLRKLKNLTFMYSGLYDLPSEFANLQQLESLTFVRYWDWDIHSGFPKAICELRNLKELTMEFCDLTFLPNEFAKLQNLEKLNIIGNKFSEFPQIIFELKNLAYLWIDEGLLTPQIKQKLKDKKIKIRLKTL